MRSRLGRLPGTASWLLEILSCFVVVVVTWLLCPTFVIVGIVWFSVVWPTRTLDLPHYLEALFTFLFLHHMFNLLNSSPYLCSPGVEVQCPLPHCVSGVPESYPVGYSTPASTQPVKYNWALAVPVHPTPKVITNLKTLQAFVAGISSRLLRRPS